MANTHFHTLCRTLLFLPSVLQKANPCFLIRELLNLKDDFRFDEFFSRLISHTLDTISFEFPIHRQTVWLKLQAELFDDSERTTTQYKMPLISILLEDVSAKYQKEAQLKVKIERIERAMNAQSQFWTTMSHEIRTPIQTIIGMTELLADTRLDHEQLEYTRQVRFSLDVLLSIINNILDYSKIEAGRMEIEHIDFPLAQTIEQVADMITLEAHKKGLEVSLDIPRNAHVYINGDPNKFRQIFINLAKNAVKFTEQGSIAITVSIVNELLTITVRDSGVGVPKEKRSKLFASFMQTDATYTRRFGGTGLGLSISKNMAELMGGTITMEPNPNGGSIFSVTLPFHPVLSEHTHIEIARLKNYVQGTKLHTLIVDNHAESRRIVSAYIRDLGIDNIAAATSGEMALTMIAGAASRKNPFDLCFIDMLMPVMDGWRFAAEIHNSHDPLITNIKLILMVPHGLLNADTKMTQLKWFLAYINKPIKRFDLAHVIDSVLAEPAELEAVSVDSDIAVGESFDPHVSEAALIEGEKPLILIAEDHPINKQLFFLILDKLGYPTILADDGRDAVDKVLTHPVSLVFLDIQMPWMNGYEAARTLRSAGFKAPIIAVTAGSLSEETKLCIAAGMNDILIKPFKRLDVEKILLKWGKTIHKEAKTMIEKINRPESGHESPPASRGLLAKMNSKQECPQAASQEEIFNGQEIVDTFMGNIEMTNKLLKKFVDRTADTIENLPALLDSQDWETAQREAHTIKGSSLTLSGKELGAAAKRLETAIKNRDAPDISASITPLKEAFQRFRAAALAYIESP
ncbi:hybrid sensor histidine kinase/response regulator [Breznakiellaceae bacterium SP9]